MIRTILKSTAFIALLACGTGTSAQQAGPVRVAVIDTGVESVGPLAGVVTESYDMVHPGKPRVKIADAHGTSVAAIIASRVHVPIEIVSLRVDATGEMSRDAIAASIRKAIELRVHLIQISSYGRMTAVVKKAVAEADEAGIEIVFCAGNKGGPALPLMVAKGRTERVHVVGALDERGERAAWSARSYTPSLRMEWRDGVDVETIDSKGRRVLMTGTSFAAPILAAEIADRIGGYRESEMLASR